MKFNINNKLLLSIGVVIICLLTSCSSTNFSKTFLKDKPSVVEEGTENKALQSLSSVAKEFQPKGYNLFTNIVDAQTVLEYEKVNIPEKINNLNTSCIKLIDKSTVLMGLYTEECQKEIGVYNFKENTYKTYFSLNKDKNSELFEEACIISAVNEKYMVFKLTKNNWENTSVYLYDIENNILSKIYDYSINIKTGKNVYMNENSILIHNNNIYFDDFSYDENEKITVSLLKYDCATKKINTVMNEAQNPLLYNDEVVCITKDKNGKYKNIESINKQKVYHVEIALIEIVSSGMSFYCIENKHTDKEKLITEFQIKDLINNKNILYTTRSIGWLKANKHFVTWYDYEENIPCIYSIDLDSLLVFTEISNGMTSFYIKENYGLLFHSEENGKKDYYFFHLKNNN